MDFCKSSSPGLPVGVVARPDAVQRGGGGFHPGPPGKVVSACLMTWDKNWNRLQRAPPALGGPDAPIATVEAWDTKALQVSDWPGIYASLGTC